MVPVRSTDSKDSWSGGLLPYCWTGSEGRQASLLSEVVEVVVGGCVEGGHLYPDIPRRTGYCCAQRVRE